MTNGNIMPKPFIVASMLALLLFGMIGMASATSVHIIEPYNATITQNGSIYLGKSGPGQTFSITISSLAYNATGAQISRGWNELKAIDYPKGWIVKNSALYRSTLTVDVTPSPNASNGTYELKLSAINIGNYSKIGSINFIAYVNITPNVFRLNVSPKSLSASPGEPREITININNTGVSDSPFVINASHIPGITLQPDTVIALHHTNGVFKYAVYAQTPGIYHVVVSVNSLESPLVSKSATITLNVKPSLLDNYYAIGQGAPIFPIIYEPSYILMYIIGLLSKL